jgi:hypothetical protein
MSLINDALKKAQKQRADDAATAAPPPAAVPPPVVVPSTPSVPHALSPATAAMRTALPIRSPEQSLPVARPATTSSLRYQASSPKDPLSTKTLWLCLGAIALVLVSVGITMKFMQTPAKPVAVTKTAPAPLPDKASTPVQAGASLPVASPVVQAVAPPAPLIVPVETAPAPVVVLPAAQPTPPKPASPPPAQTVATDTPAVSLPATTATPVATAAALPPLYAPRAPAPVNPSIRIQGFIDRIRVTGIRKSDTESRVILNYRMFRVGDMVDSGLEVKLVKIEDGVLTFADSSGKTYIKLFQ